MEGKCQIITEETIKIVNISRALTHGWDYLPSDRRAESLSKLKERVINLWEQKSVRDTDFHAVLERIDTLEHKQKGEAPMADISHILDDATLDLLIHSVADCECTKRIQ